MALYIPHSIFPFGAAFVCQAGNFWTLLRTYAPKLTYIGHTERKTNFGIIIPLRLLLDVWFHYQNEHSPLNTIRSLIFYKMLRPFVSATNRQNDNITERKVYTVEASPSTFKSYIYINYHSLQRNSTKTYTMVVIIG